MVQIPAKPAVFYPDSDGQPMADNTKQFRWIVTIKENLELIFAGDPDVFVAGDLLWYPQEGNNKLRVAPDAMVVFGRPKGDRGSYKQWEEGDIAPQVVFEILSPGNTKAEMSRKLSFYDKYGPEEYYLYDPDGNVLSGWLRKEGHLSAIESMNGWVSPRLQTRFELLEDTLRILRPDGELFLSHIELDAAIQQERRRAEQERQRAEQAEMKVDRMAQKLRELGIDPDQI